MGRQIQDVEEVERDFERDHLIADQKPNNTGQSYVVDEETVKKHADAPPQRVIIIVTTAVFMGYASLVAFQRAVKVKMDVSDENHSRSQLYGIGVSFLYLGNLIFRLMHNVIFSFLIPRQRVYISITAMIISMLILGLGVFWYEWKSLGVVFIAYGLGGVAIGSFESNILSAITPLGHATKVWAIMGFPLGFSIILVAGFAALGAGLPHWGAYLIVCMVLCIAAIVYTVFVPKVHIENNSTTIKLFATQIRDYKEWAPLIWQNAVCLMFDMFFVSLFSGIMLYILDAKEVSLLTPDNSSALMNKDFFFSVYNCFTLLGDSGSRKLVYKFKLIHPGFYLILSLVGAGLCLSTVGFLAPFGIFLVFFANGAVYATSTKHIDMHVPSKYNLIALSVWLFVGDFGSFSGSFVLVPLKEWYCKDVSGVHHYMCAKKAKKKKKK